MSEVFALWSPWSVATAALSGVAMALVVHHLTANIRPALTTLLVVTLGVLWYVPLIVQRSFDDAAPPGSDARTIGTFLLYLVGFALPMSIALHVLHRRVRP